VAEACWRTQTRLRTFHPRDVSGQRPIATDRAGLTAFAAAYLAALDDRTVSEEVAEAVVAVATPQRRSWSRR
jgi:hypothetical protein